MGHIHLSRREILRSIPVLGSGALLRPVRGQRPDTKTPGVIRGALRDGAMIGGALFEATQAQEERPFMGDSLFFGTLRALASARVPLVTISGGPEVLDLRSHDIAITDAGREVLAGRSDHIALNGIDRWRGGVHLTGRDTALWRWDARSETLVS